MHRLSLSTAVLRTGNIKRKSCGLSSHLSPSVLPSWCPLLLLLRNNPGFDIVLMIIYMHIYVCVCERVHVSTYHGTYMDVRGQLGEWILSFHHVAPTNCTQTVRLSHKCLHPLSLLPAPVFPFPLERFCHPFFKSRVTGNRLFISLLPGMSSLPFLSSGCMTLGDRFFFQHLKNVVPSF